MDNRKVIQQGLDYIEENLQTDITAAELAEIAHISLFHYYRLFQQATGMPVMQYIPCVATADHPPGSQSGQYHMQPRSVGLY